MLLRKKIKDFQGPGMKIRVSQGFSRSFKTSTNPVDRISTFDPVIKSSHCFSAMILTIFHQSRDNVKGESSTKLANIFGK